MMVFNLISFETPPKQKCVVFSKTKGAWEQTQKQNDSSCLQLSDDVRVEGVQPRNDGPPMPFFCKGVGRVICTLRNGAN